MFQALEIERWKRYNSCQSSGRYRLLEAQFCTRRDVQWPAYRCPEKGHLREEIGRQGRGEDGRKGMPYVLRLSAEWPAHELLLFPQAKAHKVLQKLGDVQEIFHKRQMSLMKLAARQTRPVQPVAPRPEFSPKWVSPKIRQPSTLGRLLGERSLVALCFIGGHEGLDYCCLRCIMVTVLTDII